METPAILSHDNMGESLQLRISINFDQDLALFISDELLSSDELILSEGPGYISLEQEFATAYYINSTAAVHADLNIQDGLPVQSYPPDHMWKYDFGIFEEFSNVDGSCYDDMLIGDSKSNILSGGEGHDTICGNDGYDYLFGGGGNDLLVGGDEFVDGGAGFDTFRLEDNAGTGGTFGLSAMNASGRIMGVERIDITGDVDDDNTLTLKAGDVFSTSGSKDLYIEGNAGDTVSVTDSGWTAGADVTIDGQTYRHYVNQDYNLYIDAEIYHTFLTMRLVMP